MRITIISASADLAGGSKVLAIHARLLRERGHEVTVVAREPLVPTLRERVRAFVHREELQKIVEPSESHYAVQGIPLRMAKGLVRETDVPNADVIVATWWETAEWIREFPRSKGAKAYFVQGWERYVEHQPGEQVDATLCLPYHKITCSRFLADVITRVSGETDVTLAPNAIDPAQFDAPERGRNTRPTVGFVYARSHWKGFDVVCDAVARIRKVFPDVRLLCFGTDEPASDLPLPPGTEYEQRPAQSRIPQIYASADVWLSASRLEGFGLPALEAMGCRTPLVSTRYGGPIDFVMNGENGFLVEVDDSETMANRAIEVLRMPDREWRTMSEAAHKTAHAWTWADASQRFEQGLRRAIEKT